MTSLIDPNSSLFKHESSFTFTHLFCMNFHLKCNQTWKRRWLTIYTYYLVNKYALVKWQIGNFPSLLDNAPNNLVLVQRFSFFPKYRCFENTRKSIWNTLSLTRVIMYMCPISHFANYPLKLLGNLFFKFSIAKKNMVNNYCTMQKNIFDDIPIRFIWIWLLKKIISYLYL